LAQASLEAVAARHQRSSTSAPILVLKSWELPRGPICSKSAAC
jgi:hypothetical protein